MSEPYYADGSVTLWHGDSLEVLRELPDASFDCCVTSPPYFGLRDYGVEGQYGLEASPAEYVETMRALFGEVRRVLSDDGTLWLNLGDSYSGSWGGQGVTTKTAGKHAPIVASGQYAQKASKTGTIKPGSPGAKNLMGMPWRVAFALQDDGWILRNDIIWAKPNGMPNPVADRLATKHEHVFMFSKSLHYWFDLDPIREPLSFPEKTGHVFGGNNTEVGGVRGGTYGKTWAQRKESGAPSRRRADPSGAVGDSDFAANPNGRNPGDVWSIPTQPFSEAHFAVMPQALASRCVSAGCKPEGVVLDPFSGSGTTGLAAAKLGRRYVGIDLSSDYLDLSLRTRLAQSALDFGEASA